MKTLMVTLASLAFAAVSSAQSTDNEVFNMREPFAGVVVNPCNGEPITYSGECHVVGHEQNGAKGESVMIHTNCHSQGIGALSNTYNVSSNSVFRSQTPLACGTSESFREISRFISPRSTSNFYMTVTFVVSTDENCQVQVDVDETDTRCTGKTGF